MVVTAIVLCVLLPGIHRHCCLTSWDLLTDFFWFTMLIRYFGQMDVPVTSFAFILAMALILQRGNPRFAQLSSAIFGLFYCGYLPCFWIKLRCGLAVPALNTSKFHILFTNYYHISKMIPRNIWRYGWIYTSLAVSYFFPPTSNLLKQLHIAYKLQTCLKSYLVNNLVFHMHV